MGKVYNRFQTKTVQKPYPLGRDIQQQLSSLYKNTKVGYFAPQITGKLVMAGQDKYTNNTII